MKQAQSAPAQVILAASDTVAIPGQKLQQAVHIGKVADHAQRSPQRPFGFVAQALLIAVEIEMAILRGQFGAAPHLGGAVREAVLAGAGVAKTPRPDRNPGRGRLRLDQLEGEDVPGGVEDVERDRAPATLGVARAVDVDDGRGVAVAQGLHLA